MGSLAPDKQKIPLITLLLWITVVRSSDIFHFFDEFDTAAENASWVATLLAIVWVGLGTVLAYGLYRTFPGKSLPQALEAYLGPIVGKVLNLLLAWFFFHQAAISLRSTTDAVSTVILPRTPPIAICALLAWVIVFAVRGGIEVVGRTVIPIALGMFLAIGAITVLILGDMELARLLPVLGPGLGPIAISSIHVASLGVHLALLPMFLGFTRTPRNTGWLLQLQNLGVHGLIAFTQVLVVASMSFIVMKNKIFEFLSLVRYISVGEFIERIDPLLLAGWISTGYAAAAAFLLAALLATQTLLGLKDYRPITLPVGVLLVLVCRTLFANARERTAFVGHGEVGTPYNILFLFVLPLLLLPVFYLRRRAQGGSGEQTDSGTGEQRPGSNGTD